MQSMFLPPVRRAFQRSRIKVNIGPGRKFAKNGWLTVDYYLADANIHLDLRECPRLPFATSTVDKIFCSHVIEHLSDRAAEHLMRECFRVLRGGGTLRLSCPDVEKAIRQHQAGSCDPEDEVITSTMKGTPSHLRLLNVICSFRAPSYQGIRNTSDNTYSGGPIATAEEVNQRLEQNSIAEFATWAHSLTPETATYRAHINAFWPEKLLQKLTEAGFSEINHSAFRLSTDPELRGKDFDNRPNISLYFEARPGAFSKRLLGALAFFLRGMKKLAFMWFGKVS